MRLLFAFLLISGMVSAQKIQPVRITELVQQYQQTEGVVVVNFWSTWCKPCIEEIPHFLETTEQFKKEGVQLWLVSQDTDDLYKKGKLKTYIAQKDWKPAKLFWLNETNADYYCPLIDASWSGVIPATLVYNKKRNYFQFYETSLTPAELTTAIQKAL